MKQYIVDAFADELFTGNPAAVLPCRAFPADELMQKLAIENNYSETAFVVKKEKGRYDLRWFTPGGEIDLCGHATLAASFVVSTFVDPDVTEMRFDTLSGELIVTREGDLFTMDFPVGRSSLIPVTDAIQAAAGGLAKQAWYDGGDMVVVAESERNVREFVPDGDRIKAVDGLGFILTAPGETCDFVSRCFYPKLAILEDPVTGRAHTYTTPLWSRWLGKETMTARQLSARGGALTVRMAGERVRISGRVQLFMAGDIPFEL